MNRALVLALIVLSIVTVAGAVAFAAVDAAVLNPWQIAVATAVATVLGVPIVQFIKKKFLKDDATKTLLRIVVYGVSFALGVAVLAITGGLKGLTLNQMIAQGSILFVAMTLVYSKIADKFELSR